MKKILITGCSGFVSGHFVDFLESQKIKASVLGLDVVVGSSHKELQYVECELRQMDLLDEQKLDHTIYQFQPDYILHLASYSSVAFSWKNPAVSFQNNTNIFLNLVESVRRIGLRSRILSIGSSEEYGNINQDHLPLVEDLPLDPISPYAVARVSQEMLSRIYCIGYGMDIVLTRSFNHCGPGQRDMFVVSSFAKQIAQIAKYEHRKGLITTGDLSIVRDFTDVRDVVRAYYLLLTKAESGQIYNVCSGSGISLQQIIDKLTRIAGASIQTRVNPEFVRPNDNKVIVGSAQKLKDVVGWSPNYSIDESLTDTYNYWFDIV